MLYLMRHGKTDWNDLYKLQGRTDIPLNEEGRRMAAEARSLYSDITFDICFCSPLLRARETAELFLEGKNIPIHYDDRLLEMCFGIFEGTPYGPTDRQGAIRTLFETPEKYEGVPGGETFAELFSRTGEFLDEKIAPLLKEGKNVLIVGHGAMNSSIVCHMRGLPVSEFWSAGIPNCRLMPLP